MQDILYLEEDKKKKRRQNIFAEITSNKPMEKHLLNA